jgi:hypothetical protein
MGRLRIVAIIVAATSSSCVGAGLMGASTDANTVADASAEGPSTGDTTATTAPTSNDPTQGPSSVDDTSGCVAAAWDDEQWDGACWQ